MNSHDQANKIDDLKRVASTELIDNLAKAKKESGERLGAIAFAHLVALCLDDPSIQSCLEPSQVRNAKASLSKEINKLSENGTPADQLVFLDEIYSVCKSLSVLLTGTERLVPISNTGFLLGVLSDKNHGRNSSIPAIRKCLLQAGIRVESLLSNLGSQNRRPAFRSFIYKPLGYGEDLTARVNSGIWPECPLIGMKDVLVNIMRRLPYRSVCLTGEKGVGKSAIVQGLAWHLATGSAIARRKTRDWRIVAISRADLLAGTSDQGALEERLKELLEYFRANRNVIPFFDEVHVLLNAKDNLGSRVINILKPPMADGSFRVLAATTDKEYGQYIMPDEPLSSRFSPVVFVPEPVPEVAAQILTKAKETVYPNDAKELGVQFPDDLIPRVVELTNKYQKGDSLPRKGFDLLRSVVESKCYDMEISVTKNVNPVIDETYLVQTAQRMFGVSLNREKEGYWEGFSKKFSATFPANESVGVTIAAYMMRHARGLVELNRGERAPLARILLSGGDPLVHAKICDFLQSNLYADASGAYIENMAQFTEETSRYRLVGAPPGYVAYEDTKDSTVFAKIKRRPQGGVFHLGSFQKTHPSIVTDVVSLLDGAAKDAMNYQVDLSQWIVLISVDSFDSGAAAAQSSRETLIRVFPELAAVFYRADICCELQSEKHSTDEDLRSLLSRYQSVGIELPDRFSIPANVENMEREAKDCNIPVSEFLLQNMQEHFEQTIKSQAPSHK